ncbi:hypothetical protein AB4Y38_40865 [Paraburkholderia sp. EG285A]|uniref:hypothetical protein n=1 Tax=Paraburkholderia sp. EG285A TaxID=3237009 RepID=UPI0034D22EA6
MRETLNSPAPPRARGGAKCMIATVECKATPVLCFDEVDGKAVEQQPSFCRQENPQSIDLRSLITGLRIGRGAQSGFVSGATASTHTNTNARTGWQTGKAHDTVKELFGGGCHCKIWQHDLKKRRIEQSSGTLRKASGTER